MKTRTCLGFGATEGKCTNVAGCRHSPYWCTACNEVRMDHITKQLEAIAGRYLTMDTAAGPKEVP